MVLFRKRTDKSSKMAPKLFTELHPIAASSLPAAGSEEFQKHIDELMAAATELIESTPQWKSKGRYNHVVEVRERMDWRGKRNWFLRRSVHKGVSFDVFKVKILFAMIDIREDCWRITQRMKKNLLR
jgi:hypothetical protein